MRKQMQKQNAEQQDMVAENTESSAVDIAAIAAQMDAAKTEEATPQENGEAGEGVEQEKEGDASEEESKTEEESEQKEKEDEDEDETPKDETKGLGRGWAQIKKAEKRVRQMTAELKTEREEVRALKEQAAQSEDFIASLRKDPLTALNKAGVSFDDIARRVLNDGAPSQEEETRSKEEKQSETEKALRERLDRLEQSVTQREQARYVKEYQDEIKSALDADEFELLRQHPNAAEEVLSYASMHAREHGEALSAKDIAVILQDEWKQELMAQIDSEAIQKALGLQLVSKQEQKEDTKSRSVKSAGRTPATLTNHMATTPAKSGRSLDDLTPDELIAEIAKNIDPAALQGL